MSDSCVARVLTQLLAAERQLEDLELQTRQQAEPWLLSSDAAAAARDTDLRQREQFLLGQIEGLVMAQLALSNRRIVYSRGHRFLPIQANADSYGDAAPAPTQAGVGAAGHELGDPAADDTV